MTTARALPALALAVALAACSGGGGGGGTPPGCTLTGQGCSTSASCCSGSCGPLGTCVETCGELFDSCTVSAQCCADLGCSGSNPAFGTFCASCSGEGLSCTRDNDCCSGLDCRGSTCLGGTCSTQGQPCSNGGECCAHLRCDGGSCRCGTIGETCGATEDCCGGQVCAGDGRCHPVDASDGARCLADGDCALGSCAGVTSTPGTCCQDAAASCAPAGATCCAGSVCRGPEDGSQTCGACMPLLAQTCYRTSECCSGNLCEGGRCCEPIGASCASPDQCCNGRCGRFEPELGTTTTPHCCGGTGASCRLDQASTCCEGFHCYGAGNPLPWPAGTCLAQPGSDCATDGDCYLHASGSVCIPRDATPGAPTVCSAWLDQPCSALIPCPAPLVCDPDQGQCSIPPGEACSYEPSCVTGTSCDLGVCCSHPGAGCGGSTECCTGTCDTGACACGGPGVHCATPSDCCAGDECHWIQGTNDYTCCALERSACQTAADCCYANLDCDGTCCRPVGDSCSYSEWQAGLQCCNGAVCTRESRGGIYSYVCR